ncbi:MAG: preprotein translocase subunit SecY, partial [Planctomycetales bacterium]|nr:preprotein translocase subunit SecY [Planctomycetales bacterium]
MLEKLRVVFTIPELRQKILLTLGLLAVYRVGYLIPMPMVDGAQLDVLSQSQGAGGLAGLIAKATVFSASQLDKATIFGLGIMPYITASIILQLLGTVYPPLMELRKEGEAGRNRINDYTRRLTVVLCIVQSIAYVWLYLMGTSGENGPNLIAEQFEDVNGNMYWGWQVVAVLIMTCGTVFLMWIGEQIDEYGIGNGISLLIMAGIVADMPGALYRLIGDSSFELTGFQSTGIETYLVLVLLFVAVVVGVVFITLAQRRIPTQSAKHVRGRRVYGGTKQYLPLRINQAGVMPIIFASSLLMLPALLFNGLGNLPGWFGSTFSSLGEMFGNGTSFAYNLFFLVMIYFFCYFWTSIIFNPKEISDNLKDHGTFVPGYRPGKRTADYLERVMERITYVGAGFLAAVAVIPTVISSGMNVDYQIA